MEKINADYKVNKELDKFRLNFSRCANHDVTVRVKSNMNLE